MSDDEQAGLIEASVSSFEADIENARAEGRRAALIEAIKIAGTVEWCKECLATDQIADQLQTLLDCMRIRR